MNSEVVNFKQFENIGYNNLLKFASNTFKLCKILKECGVINNYTTPWGGLKPNKRNNIIAAKKMGIDNWFDYAQDINTTVDDMARRILSIKGDHWRTYCISKLLKTRVAYSDSSILDCFGCKHNDNMLDYTYSNEVFGVKFTIRNTYFSNKYPTIDSIKDDVYGFLKTMYADCTSKKDGSERGHSGELSNRIFIINNSEESNVKKFFVESASKPRFEHLRHMMESISQNNIFQFDVLNENDNKYYNVKCMVFIVNQTSEFGLQSTLLGKKNG